MKKRKIIPESIQIIKQPNANLTKEKPRKKKVKLQKQQNISLKKEKKNQVNLNELSKLSPI